MSRFRQHPTATDAIATARAAAEEARATGANVAAVVTHYEHAVEQLSDDVQQLDRTLDDLLTTLSAAQAARRSYLATRPLRRLIVAWLTGEAHEAEATEDPRPARPEGEGPTDRHVW